MRRSPSRSNPDDQVPLKLKQYRGYVEFLQVTGNFGKMLRKLFPHISVIVYCFFKALAF